METAEHHSDRASSESHERTESMHSKLGVEARKELCETDHQRQWQTMEEQHTQDLTF
jgi:hypothetical protein